MKRHTRLGVVLSASSVGLVSLAAYVLTLAPGLTWAHDSADGGLLAASAYTLGIAHPPGHPTYVLLAYPFAHLGLAWVAQGTNLFSAVCAAATAALVCASVQLACLSSACAASLGEDISLCLSGASAGLLFAFSPLSWSMATVTEVHALSALFSALLLVLAVRSTARRSMRRGHATAWAAAAGVLFGLALGTHPTAVLTAGPLAVATTIALARAARAPIVAVVAAAGLGVGLSVYLLLPLRAAASPPINWGDPRTLQRFWHVLTGASYRAYIFGLPAAFIPARVAGSASLLMRQVTPVGLLFAVAGALYGTGRDDRAVTAAAAMAIVSVYVFAIGYNTADSYQYLLASLPLLVHWAGLGLCATSVGFGRIKGRTARSLALLPAASLAGVLALGVVRYQGQNLRGEHSAFAFAEATLGAAPPDAVVITGRDAHTFALWYCQVAEGWRRDVVVVDAGLLGEAWYNETVADQLGLHADAVEALLGSESVPRDLLGRPVCRVTGGGEIPRFGLDCAG
jgi:hypothetical protein